MINRTNLKTWLAMGICLLVMAGTAQGRWAEQNKLLASDSTAHDLFGGSVSISGDYAIVGATNAEYLRRSAYILKRDGASWVEQAKLTTSGGSRVDVFGCSVSISGDYAIVGASKDYDNGDNSGAAYIFKRDGTSWSQQAKLTASDGAPEDSFGRSVSISGRYAIIGAIGDDDKGGNSGSAYIFRRDGAGWSQQAKLTASDGDRLDCYGGSVSISGDYVIVGAYNDDDNGGGSGSAYVSKRDGTSWSQQAKLTASDPAPVDFFGWSVSINGDYAVVGAFRDDDKGPDSGSAYIFKRDATSWNQQAKLIASDGTYGDYFGRSVSISGDYAIIGADGDDDNGGNSGSAYIFQRDATSWIEQDKLIASDGAQLDNFGCAVSISGDYAVAGAYQDDDNGSSSGSIYIFNKVGPIFYVDGTASGHNNGSSWGDAYNYLQDALDTAQSGEEIWVVEGTYMPDQGVNVTPGDRAATFQLKYDVDLYGGFPSGGSTWEDSDPAEYVTILSGDLAGNDGPNFANNGENSYSVVTCEEIRLRAILDGFTITGGNGGSGGGVRILAGSPTITNCTIIGNSAGNGGGIYGNGGISNCLIIGNFAAQKGGGTFGTRGLSNCTIRGNETEGKGGGIYCSYLVIPPYYDSRGDPLYHRFDSTFSNCVIANNKASEGAGIYWHYTRTVYYSGGSSDVVEGRQELINCTISGNEAKTKGGGIYTNVSIDSIANCIIWGNAAHVEGNETMTYNADMWVEYSNIGGTSSYIPDGMHWLSESMDDDPLFFDPDGLDAWDDNDYWLSAGSPCIDAANGNMAPATDIDGYERFDDPDTTNTGWGTDSNPEYVEIGAHEFGGLINTVPDVRGQAQATAQSNIVAAGLVVGNVTTAHSDSVPAGNVISQSPVGGSSVVIGSVVDLVISDSPHMVIVPNAVGLSQASAQSAMTAAGLVVGNVTTAYSNTVPAGNVISESPAGGSSVVTGSTVDLIISDGGHPLSAILLAKCKVKAGKTAGKDSISFTGILKDITAADLNGAGEIYITIVSDVDGHVAYPIDNDPLIINPVKVKKGKYSHKDKQKGISFKIDANKGKFSLKIKNADLTGLGSPLSLEIEIGSYYGAGSADETKVNGKKPIPIQLMSGYKDTLPPPLKIKAKNGKKEFTDSLAVKGGFSLKDEPSPITSMTLFLGGQSIHLTDDTGTFTYKRNKKTSRITSVAYKSGKGETPQIKARFDFVKCSYSVSIKKAELETTSGQIDFGVLIDMSLSDSDYNESVPVHLD